VKISDEPRGLAPSGFRNAHISLNRVGRSLSNRQNGRGVTLHRTYILRHPFSGPLKLKLYHANVLLLSLSVQPERKKEYLLDTAYPVPAGSVESQGPNSITLPLSGLLLYIRNSGSA
jgi:hypothetical protein